MDLGPVFDTQQILEAFYFALIVSYNIATGAIIYHVVSINNSTGNITTLNFSENNLINSINKVDDLLFFTDNINPPRVININKSYAVPLNNVDRFLANDLLVILLHQQLT